MQSFFSKVKYRFHQTLLFTFIGLGFKYANAQDIMMQGWYWDYPKTTQEACWADTLRFKASELGHSGFTGIWLPPLARASFGNSSNGYDPKDLYDYGQYGTGNVATGFGTRTQLDNTISALNAAGVKSIADLVFNHRDGGKAEINPGLASYIAGYNWTKANSGANPFPYDRMRCFLPLGGSSGNGAGDYYFKISSSSGHAKFHNYEYKVYMQTNTVGWKSLAALAESEPNGGADCSQVNNNTELGRDMNATVDNDPGCGVDEFHLSLSVSDFNAAGDTIFFYLGNRNSGYSDMRIYSIWSGPRNTNIVADLKYQSYTDFSGLPSGQGAMNWSNFKPNNDRTTSLEGDWDGMYFFYDYDQFQPDTKTKLFDWTRWNWSNVGIKGLRMDAVKHFTPEFVGDLLDNLHDNGMDPPFVVGEWYSTTTSELAGWVNSVLSYMDIDTKAAINPRIFDFSLRESLRQSCDQVGYDVRNVFTSSLVDASGLSGFNVITFANNHDFRDGSGFASLIHNTPMLAYAYLLTNNKVGLPCVFYPDYYGYPNNGSGYYPPDRNGQKTKINQLMSLHKAYILGSTSVTYLNKSGSGFANDAGTANSYILTYQLKGGIAGRDVVVAINFGGGRVQFHQELNGLAVGTKLTDIMGVSPYPEANVQANENGIPNDIWIDLPARSYAVWVQGEATTITPLPASNLSIAGITASSLSLAWTDNSSNETGFRIERKTESGSWLALTTVAANTSTYTDNSIVTFEHYYYRVFAINGGLSSSASNEADGPATWTGSTNRNWNNTGNWTSTKIPEAGETVIIPSESVTNFPVISTLGLSYTNIWIKDGANLQIDAGGQLTVTGSLMNQAGNTGLALKSGGSLIQNSAGISATVVREINAWGAGGFQGWHLLSSPVATQAIATGFTAPVPENYDFYAWWEPTNEWINFKNTVTDPTWNTANVLGSVTGGTNFIPGKGYLVAYQVTGTKQFAGTLNTADIPITGLTKSSGTYPGWHLLGNPFPSALKWNDANWLLTNVTSTAKIWKESTAAYIDIPAATGIIPAMNGFVVETSGSGSLTIPGAARMHSTTAWYKNSEDQIKLIANDLENNTAQESIVKVEISATEGYDPEFDSHFLAGFAPKFYSTAGSERLSTNTLPAIENNRIISLGFEKNTGGNFSIELVQNSLNNVSSIYLTDKKTGIKTDLSKTPIYNFSATDGDDVNRFELSFANTFDVNPEISSDMMIYTYDKTLFINQTDAKKGLIRIYSALGQSAGTYILDAIISQTVDLSNLMPGIYLVTVSTEKGLYKKKVAL